MPRVVQIAGSVQALPAYDAQLLILHQHRAKSQYRTWLIKSSRLLRVSGSTQATLEQESLIQVLPELSVA